MTLLTSATGSLNPNIADGGWHEVTIKGLDGVTVELDDQIFVTGHLKEFKVKLDKSSSTLAPIVKEFKLVLEAETSIPDVKKGNVGMVIVTTPGSTAIAVDGTEFEEKIKDTPAVLNGHTRAMHDEGMVGEIIPALQDGFNHNLKERKGPCSVSGG